LNAICESEGDGHNSYTSSHTRAHDNVFCSSESYKVFFFSSSYLNTMETIGPLVSYTYITCTNNISWRMLRVCVCVCVKTRGTARRANATAAEVCSLRRISRDYAHRDRRKSYPSPSSVRPGNRVRFGLGGCGLRAARTHNSVAGPAKLYCYYSTKVPAARLHNNAHDYSGGDRCPSASIRTKDIYHYTMRITPYPAPLIIL